MQRYRFMVDPYKFSIAAATSAAFFILGAAVAFNARYGSMIIFWLFGALFAWVAWLNGSSVVLTPEGVSLYFFSHCRKSCKWEELQEIGAIGTKVLRQKNKDDAGRLEIYFSTKEMNDDERRAMALQWPPKDMIYMLYQKNRMDAVQILSDAHIHLYNTGHLHF